MGRKKHTLTEFILKGKEIHNDRYEYDETCEYENNGSKVRIKCPIHGWFEQDWNHHITRKQRCPKCDKSHKKTTEEFIDECVKKYGDSYDYSKIEYKRWDIPICVICPIHGEFWIKPNSFIFGGSCPQCAKHHHKTTEEFINISNLKHGNKYDYSKTIYVSSELPVCIICPIHGEFLQTPHHHMKGVGCPYCNGNARLTKEEFIKRSNEIHHKKYDYSKAEYINTNTKVCIICPKHGEFLQTPHHHMKGVGCPYCKLRKIEEKVAKYLEENNIIYEREKTFEWLKYKNNQRLDFYLPSFNAAIECQGAQHFEPVDFAGRGEEWAKTMFEVNTERDKNKVSLCSKNGVKLFFIDYRGNVETQINKIINLMK